MRSHTAHLPKHKGNGQNITCLLLLINDQSQRINKISTGSKCINDSGTWQSFVLDVQIPRNVHYKANTRKEGEIKEHPAQDVV